MDFNFLSSYPKDGLEANEIKKIQPININRIGVPSIKALSDDQLQVSILR